MRGKSYDSSLKFERKARLDRCTEMGHFKWTEENNNVMTLTAQGAKIGSQNQRNSQLISHEAPIG